MTPQKRKASDSLEERQSKTRKILGRALEQVLLAHDETGELAGQISEDFLDLKPHEMAKKLKVLRAQPETIRIVTAPGFESKVKGQAQEIERQAQEIERQAQEIEEAALKEGLRKQLNAIAATQSIDQFLEFLPSGCLGGEHPIPENPYEKVKDSNDRESIRKYLRGIAGNDTSRISAVFDHCQNFELESFINKIYDFGFEIEHVPRSKIFIRKCSKDIINILIENGKKRSCALLGSAGSGKVIETNIDDSFYHSGGYPCSEKRQICTGA